MVAATQWRHERPSFDEFAQCEVRLHAEQPPTERRRQTERGARVFGRAAALADSESRQPADREEMGPIWPPAECLARELDRSFRIGAVEGARRLAQHALEFERVGRRSSKLDGFVLTSAVRRRRLQHTVGARQIVGIEGPPSMLFQ